MRTALKRANKIQGNPKLKNKAQHAKNLAARRLDALTQELTTPMGRIVQAFQLQGKLHPFEEALLDLTVGLDSFNKRVKKMDNIRKSCLEVTHILRTNLHLCQYIDSLQAQRSDSPQRFTQHDGCRVYVLKQILHPIQSRYKQF